MQQQSWLHSRQTLTSHLRRQVEGFLGSSSEIYTYQREFLQKLRSGWKISNKAKLVEQVGQAHTLLLADFHGFSQSQRTHLRVLRSLPDDRPMILLCEFFDEEKQDFLDLYLKNKISEKTFLKNIDWDGYWPFPWSHYQPLIHWAKKTGVEVLGWSRFGRESHLDTRDRIMARKVDQMVKDNPGALIVGVVGELHLTPNRMPKYLNEDSILIFQDLENVYFDLAARGLETKVDIVQRHQGRQFCILSAPPWVKWQSYLMLLSSSEDEILGEEMDPTDHVHATLRILERDLGLEVSRNYLQVFSARTLPNRILRHQWAKKKLISDQSFYVPEEKLAYLSRFSVNHVAYAAGLFLHCELAGIERSLVKREDFLRIIWHEGLAFFASKLINHKRAAQTLAELRAQASGVQSSHFAKKVLQLALQQRMMEIAKAQGLARRIQPAKESLEVRLEAARVVGFMLGERLFHAFRRGRIKRKTLIEYFTRDLFASDFDRFYYEIIRTLEPSARWARDRSERL